VQRHFGGDPWQRLHQEVSCSHPRLDCAERMLDRLAPLAHFFRMLVEPALHGVENMLMLPARDPSFLAGDASATPSRACARPETSARYVIPGPSSRGGGTERADPTGPGVGAPRNWRNEPKQRHSNAPHASGVGRPPCPAKCSWPCGNPDVSAAMKLPSNTAPHSPAVMGGGAVVRYRNLTRAGATRRQSRGAQRRAGPLLIKQSKKV
jgi:hypothetical protein